MCGDASKNPPGWSLRPRSSTPKSCRLEVSFNFLLTCHFSIYPSFSFPSLILILAFPLLFNFFGNCRLFSFLELAGRTVSPASCLSFWPVHGLSGPFSLSGAPFISVQWRGLSKGWPAANSSHDRKQNNQKFGSANSFFFFFSSSLAARGKIFPFSHPKKLKP